MCNDDFFFGNVWRNISLWDISLLQVLLTSLLSNLFFAIRELVIDVTYQNLDELKKSKATLTSLTVRQHELRI